ncbi:hypothetical protein SAMN05660350_04594 [Geodermatophilus obscurus]|jgi:hypothetical protein|uniref:Uncharacterized protein n=1 Tax=Geodermatophilus obscurus TaxID=1861 RepID=A0A1M7V025_9ACTN|nr:hypothetical protein [Geodermatophilus obscurus]SHN88603.1 hypothetical protein SAMN05660350_04594 [Geodermatophilus obscurus]
MTEPDNSGYRESPDTTDGPTSTNMVDGVPGEDRSDGGEQDVTLTTDDDAQRDDSVVRGGNEAS